MIYGLFWGEFCSEYLEYIKPNIDHSLSKEVYEKTIFFFETLLKLLHPFMPFITEEIYHLLKNQKDDICISTYPQFTLKQSFVWEIKGRMLRNSITAIKDLRKKYNLKAKDRITVFIKTEYESHYREFLDILSKRTNATILFINEPIKNLITIVINEDTFFIKTEKQQDTSGLREELLKDLEYQNNFLNSVLKKLNNERFVQNAKPEVVELERKKQADAEARIKTIEESLQNLD